MDKTVYILGAGFSIASGAPSQANLLKEIFNLRKILPPKENQKVYSWLDKLDKFLNKALLVTENEKENYSLEDIYTPIDKSIIESISFRDYTPFDLLDLRDSINRLIIVALRKSIQNSRKDQKLMEKFANHIITRSKERLLDEKNDPVSVITTNWDPILDNKVYQIINKDPVPLGHKFSGVVDYCCYISSLEEKNEKIKPGLYAIGKGRYNVKILKLHGSVNWSQCPKCQRLYVAFYNTPHQGGYVIVNKYCRHCEKNFDDPKGISHRLYANLITPTFLKNLNNIQNKLIWQNAGIELSEAKKIVFIGYSLPQADFEFKQLLSRMIRSDAEIEVVLIPSDNPEDDSNKGKKHLTAGYRYINFFSGRKINISYKGVEDFVNNL